MSNMGSVLVVLCKYSVYLWILSVWSLTEKDMLEDPTRTVDCFTPFSIIMLVLHKLNFFVVCVLVWLLSLLERTLVFMWWSFSSLVIVLVLKFTSSEFNMVTLLVSVCISCSFHFYYISLYLKWISCTKKTVELYLVFLSLKFNLSTCQSLIFSIESYIFIAVVNVVGLNSILNHLASCFLFAPSDLCHFSSFPYHPLGFFYDFTKNFIILFPLLIY